MKSLEHLFFIALLPPPEIQSEVTQIKQYFAKNYDSRHALKSPPHITLQSPFKWLTSDLKRLDQSLKTFAAQQAGFPVTLSGFNAFPPRVIYIDVVKTPALMNLQNNLVTDLQDNLGDFNSRSNPDNFTPHMTVAFRDLSRKNFRVGWTEFQNKPIQFEFESSQLTLLIHTGKDWQVHQEYIFGKSQHN
jgi:2'-5' RNA ligase